MQNKNSQRLGPNAMNCHWNRYAEALSLRHIIH